METHRHHSDLDCLTHLLLWLLSCKSTITGLKSLNMWAARYLLVLLHLILSQPPRHGKYDLCLSDMSEILILSEPPKYGDYDLRLSVMSKTPQGGNGNQGQTLSIGRQCSDHLRSYLISPLCSFLFLTYIHVFPPSVLSYFLLTM